MLSLDTDKNIDKDKDIDIDVDIDRKMERSLFLKFDFYYFMCISFCVWETMESRKRCWISCSWSYIQL